MALVQIRECRFLFKTKALWNRMSAFGFPWILIPFLVGIAFLGYSFLENNAFGFPLDDSWIHLTFAGNLVASKSFSYFHNEIPTSGSTSPLYTLLLALLWTIWHNEFFISYTLGLTFLALTMGYVYQLVKLDFKPWKKVVLPLAILIALQPKLILIAVSGMETTLFIWLLAAAIYYYKQHRFLPMGIFLGFLVWCRPDGLVLWLALALDYTAGLYVACKIPDPDFPRPQKLLASLPGLLILTGGYFLFNYTLSGSLLPNTYQAKLALYGTISRPHFLAADVAGLFFNREFALIWPTFFLGTILAGYAWTQKKYSPFLVYILFIFLFISTYTVMLPFGHRFGRYLIPVIPFYLMVSIYGAIVLFLFLFRMLPQKIRPALRVLGAFFAAALLLLTVFGIFDDAHRYTFFCRYHNQRQVAAGKWLDRHTPPNAIIATHDIGAIGFYSHRKIIDILGLVTPEVIPLLKTCVSLPDYLPRRNVSYVVVLKNWFQVSNATLLFRPVETPEYLEIYQFNPGQTRLQARMKNAGTR
jgi:arabinofuranosyltransferase